MAPDVWEKITAVKDRADERWTRTASGPDHNVHKHQIYCSIWLNNDSSSRLVSDGEKSHFSLCMTQKVVARCHFEREAII